MAFNMKISSFFLWLRFKRKSRRKSFSAQREFKLEIITAEEIEVGGYSAYNKLIP
jgi:hypothetical protein